MNKKILLLITFLLMPALAIGQQTDTPCPETIKVGFNEWAPYSWTDTSGKAVGLDVDMLTLVANHLGCQLTFIKMPAKRAHQMLQAGTLDLMMGASFTEDRTAYAYFSDSYRTEEVRLFVKADRAAQINVDKWQDIFTQRLKLLVPTYGWYGLDYLRSKEELSRQGLLVLSPNSHQSIQMLSYERGDILIGDAIALPYMAQHAEGVVLSPLNLLVDSNQIHFMFSKKVNNRTLLNAINQSISDLSHQGELARIIMKWQQVSLAQTHEMPPKPTGELHPSKQPDGALNSSGSSDSNYSR
ncbi:MULTISPECIES: substrate-binding periplasmic protein [Shewanella]|nr:MULTISPECIES: transporter substrate-binding domain-containing protein [Shewanella]